MREDILDKLAGTNVTFKSEEDITYKSQLIITKNFRNLTQHWTRVFFIVVMESSSDRSLKASAKKMHREFMVADKNYYNSVFKPLYDETKRKHFVIDDRWMKDQLHAVLCERGGEKDFIILAKSLYNTGMQQIVTHSGVKMNLDMYKQIQSTYEEEYQEILSTKKK